jgi:hypothetical protein
VALSTPDATATSTWVVAPVATNATNATAARRRPTTSPADQRQLAIPQIDTNPPVSSSTSYAAGPTGSEPAGPTGSEPAGANGKG